MTTSALIFAGGTGSRMNTKTLPKQFLELHGKPIIIHTIEHFEDHPAVSDIVVVCVDGWLDYCRDLLARFNIKKVSQVVPGGETGQMSIFNGLSVLREKYKNDDDYVLIHDGVRPLVDSATIERNIESVESKGSAITVTPAIETIMVTQDGSINGILNRNECLMAKAPQSFRLDDILSVHDRAKDDGIHDFIDSASMMMHYGYTLYPVIGETENIKITTPSDYYMFTGIIKNRELGGLKDE